MNPTNFLSLRAPSASRRVRSIDDRVWLVLVLAPFIGVSFLAKFAIPPFGNLGIAIGVLVNLMATGYALMRGAARINGISLASILLFTGYAALVSIGGNGAYSISSLLFFLFIHLPYAVMLGSEKTRRQSIYELFVNAALFLAVLGIVQYLVQFALGPSIAFPIENFVPDIFQVQAFNKQGAIGYGVDVYRANGIFMIEPSVFSQLLAIGVVFEIVSGKGRPLAVILMLVGIILSYSGTGIVILLVCAPILLLRHWQRWMWYALGGSVLAAIVAAQFVDFSFLSSRAGEFDETGSSGFARFVGGFYFFDQFLWTDWLATIFGKGAGEFKNYAWSALYPVVEMPITKMVFEFGLIGALAYFAAIFLLMARSGQPLVLVVAVFMTFILNGLYVGFAHGLALTLFVWPQSINAEREK